MLLTVRWGQFKPSQPSPRVAKVGPNQTVTTTPATTPQAGPLQAALPGPNQAVTATYRRVKANQGASGVDGVTLGDFEKDLKHNLYKIWNRMSSGSYFPPPVKAVEI